MDADRSAVTAAQTFLEDLEEPDSSLFPSSSRKVWWVLGGAAIAVGLAVSIWLSYEGAYAKPTWTTTAWKIDGPASATVTFRMTQPANMAVTCQIEALDFEHRVVGSSHMQLEPGPRQERILTATVKTAAPAVLGRVRWCHDAASTEKSE